MPYKVKEHYRKTKKGLVRVKESDRKDKAKKALVVGAAALTTLGLGALAYKNITKKVVKTVGNKVDDVVSNIKTTETLPDPWLDDVLTVSKSTKGVSVPKQEQKLLPPFKHKAPEYVKPTKPSKGFIKEDGSNQNLKQAIRSNRELISREPTDIKNTLKRLELGEGYIKRTDSPAYINTGNTYIKTANKRLATISNRRLKRKKARALVIKGKTRNSVRQGESSMLVLKKKLEDVPKAPDLVTKEKAKKTLADTLGQSILKDERKIQINKVLDDIVPGSGLVRGKILDVKDRVKQADRLLKELEANGEKVSSRRGFFTNTVKKVAKEAAKKPKDPTNIARGVANKSKVNIRRGYSKLNTSPEITGNPTKNNWLTKSDPFQVDITKAKRVYRQPRGLLERMTQTAKKVARYKSGNHQT